MARGHYEIDTGEGWEHLMEGEFDLLMVLWGREPTGDRTLLQDGSRIRTGIADYRYVEDAVEVEE
jgi:hypothetical protein